MKRFALGLVLAAGSIAPAFAGGGGSDEGVATTLIQTVSALFAKLFGLL